MDTFTTGSEVGNGDESIDDSEGIGRSRSIFVV